MGVNAYMRRVDNVILQRIYQDGNGTWVSSPTNSGKALVRGLELEAKSSLPMLWPALPEIDVRTGLTRNWSRVEDVPGPGNRLSQQPMLTATVGVDYKLRTAPLTLGSNFSFEKSGYSRSSAERATLSLPKRTLDMYGLWSVDKSTRVRLTVANVLKQPSTVQNCFDDGALQENQTVVSPSSRRFTLQFEARI